MGSGRRARCEQRHLHGNLCTARTAHNNVDKTFRGSILVQTARLKAYHEISQLHQKACQAIRCTKICTWRKSCPFLKGLTSTRRLKLCKLTVMTGACPLRHKLGAWKYRGMNLHVLQDGCHAGGVVQRLCPEGATHDEARPGLLARLRHCRRAAGRPGDRVALDCLPQAPLSPSASWHHGHAGMEILKPELKHHSCCNRAAVDCTDCKPLSFRTPSAQPLPHLA